MPLSGQSSESVSPSSDNIKSNGSTDKETGDWTSSKKVINHKTRQVETRIQRQIVMEDGKVIADSGPQVTTRTKEDAWTEESEAVAKKGRDESINRPEVGEVISEKVETKNTTREAKQERLQYHDESIAELSGFEIHQKVLTSPNDLITINCEPVEVNKVNGDLVGPIEPRGRLTHYSSQCHKIIDKEEVKETSKLGPDGKITTETVKTTHHEEVDDDEKPETGNDIDGALPEASSERKVEYSEDYLPLKEPRNISPIYEIDGKVDHTNKWIESHFGSSEPSTSLETSGEDRSYQSHKVLSGNGSVVDRRGRPRQRINPIMSQSYDEAYFSRSNGHVETSPSNSSKPRVVRLSHSKDDISNGLIKSPDGLKDNGSASNSSGYYNGYYHSSESSISPPIEGQTRLREGQLVADKSPTHSTRLGSLVIRIKKKVPKEDASVQASLSDEDSDFENIDEGIVRSPSSSTFEVQSNGTNSGRSRPVKTYYFGENLITKKNFNGIKVDNNNNNNTESSPSYEKNQTTDRCKVSQTRIIPITVDECYAKNERSSERKAKKDQTFDRSDNSVSLDNRNPINDRLIKDSLSVNKSSRLYNSSADLREAEKLLDRLMFRSRTDLFQTQDNHRPLSNWRSTTNLRSNGTRDFTDLTLGRSNGNGLYKSKDDFYTRPRDHIIKSNLTRNHLVGSVNRLSDQYRSDRVDYLTPTNRTSYGLTSPRGLSPIRENRYRSRKLDHLLLTSTPKESIKWPEFTPYISPSEMSKVSNLYSREIAYSPTRSFYKSPPYERAYFGAY